MTTATRTKRVTKATRVAKILDMRAKASALYKEAEALEAGIQDAIGIGEVITLPDGRSVVLVDQFADKNCVWKACAVQRFILKVV